MSSAKVLQNRHDAKDSFQEPQRSGSAALVQKEVLPPLSWFITLLLVANTPCYLVIGWTVFGSWSGFCDTLRQTLSADSDYCSNEEHFEGFWAHIKIGLFIAPCGALLYLEYVLF